MRFFWKRRREYAIPVDREEWAAPEETLVDAGSNLSDVELPVEDRVFQGAVWLAGILLLVVVAAAAWLTIGRHDELAALAWRNRTVNVAVPPPRGVIFDRNGEVLVQNVPSFDLLVISRQVRQTTDGTFPDIDRIADALGRDAEDLTLSLNDLLRKNAVFFLATDIGRDAVLQLKNVLPDGFYLITSTKRAYESGPQFAHILGYVGKVSREDMAQDSYYLPTDTIGRLGIESSYEEVLRGTHGQLLFASAEETDRSLAKAGQNLALEIDASLQRALWQSVWDALRESGLSQAAAVVQDVQSGAVLGMASFPTYDNNIFSGPLSQEDAAHLFNNKERPLFNRTISGLYNPGSTIKPFIGMAALEEDVVEPEQLVHHDCISITIPNPTVPDRPYVFANWRRDLGWFDLQRAIADSCNVYFYTIGGGHGEIAGLGIERIVNYLKASFADSPLGIDLPGEDYGFVPTPDWKWVTKKEAWYQGDTYNVSIGQGDLLVTPLWINTSTAAIANGGTLWEPQVVDRIVDDQRQTVQDWEPTRLGSLPFSTDVIRVMQRAMEETVRSGTGKSLQGIGGTVAAKTGTAEVVKGQRVNSLVTVYAPAENPRIAATILVEGSPENKSYALLAMRQFLQWYFRAGSFATPTP